MLKVRCVSEVHRLDDTYRVTVVIAEYLARDASGK